VSAENDFFVDDEARFFGDNSVADEFLDFREDSNQLLFPTSSAFFANYQGNITLPHVRTKALKNLESNGNSHFEKQEYQAAAEEWEIAFHLLSSIAPTDNWKHRRNFAKALFKTALEQRETYTAERTLTIYRRALKLGSEPRTRANILREMGNTYMHSYRFRQALLYYQQALSEIDESDCYGKAKLHVNMGQCLAHELNKPDAEREYDSAMELGQNQTGDRWDVLKAEMMSNRANLETRGKGSLSEEAMRLYEQAIRKIQNVPDLEACLELKKGDVRHPSTLAKLLRNVVPLLTWEDEKTDRICELALSLEPDPRKKALASKAWGLTLFRQGRIEESMKRHEIACKYSSADPLDREMCRARFYYARSCESHSRSTGELEGVKKAISILEGLYCQHEALFKKTQNNNLVITNPHQLREFDKVLQALARCYQFNGEVEKAFELLIKEAQRWRKFAAFNLRLLNKAAEIKEDASLDQVYRLRAKIYGEQCRWQMAVKEMSKIETKSSEDLQTLNSHQTDWTKQTQSMGTEVACLWQNCLDTRSEIETMVSQELRFVTKKYIKDHQETISGKLQNFLCDLVIKLRSLLDYQMLAFVKEWSDQKNCNEEMLFPIFPSRKELCKRLVQAHLLPPRLPEFIKKYFTLEKMAEFELKRLQTLGFIEEARGKYFLTDAQPEPGFDGDVLSKAAQNRVVSKKSLEKAIEEEVSVLRKRTETIQADVERKWAHHLAQQDSIELSGQEWERISGLHWTSGQCVTLEKVHDQDWTRLCRDVVSLRSKGKTGVQDSTYTKIVARVKERSLKEQVLFEEFLRLGWICKRQEGKQDDNFLDDEFQVAEPMPSQAAMPKDIDFLYQQFQVAVTEYKDLQTQRWLPAPVFEAIRKHQPCEGNTWLNQITSIANNGKHVRLTHGDLRERIYKFVGLIPTRPTTLMLELTEPQGAVFTWTFEPALLDIEESRQTVSRKIYSSLLDKHIIEIDGKHTVCSKDFAGDFFRPKQDGKEEDAEQYLNTATQKLEAVLTFCSHEQCSCITQILLRLAGQADQRCFVPNQTVDVEKFLNTSFEGVEEILMALGTPLKKVGNLVLKNEPDLTFMNTLYKTSTIELVEKLADGLPDFLQPPLKERIVVLAKRKLDLLSRATEAIGWLARYYEKQNLWHDQYRLTMEASLVQNQETARIAEIDCSKIKEDRQRWKGNVDEDITAQLEQAMSLLDGLRRSVWCMMFDGHDDFTTRTGIGEIVSKLRSILDQSTTRWVHAQLDKNGDVSRKQVRFPVLQRPEEFSRWAKNEGLCDDQAKNGKVWECFEHAQPTQGSKPADRWVEIISDQANSFKHAGLPIISFPEMKEMKAGDSAREEGIDMCVLECALRTKGSPEPCKSKWSRSLPRLSRKREISLLKCFAISRSVKKIG